MGILTLVLPLIHAHLHCKATSISFDDDKLVHETGILNNRKKKIPVNMITDSSSSRTFIEKFLGTGTLSISTSGSTGYEMVCDGLDYSELETLHQKLYSRIRILKAEEQKK
ncbi:PH domain-containing protein [Candidatus Micrarchaeota archaeon]|nr:PH domain-containing protein [Candidatus Micrarchaeota archaeon]